MDLSLFGQGGAGRELIVGTCARHQRSHLVDVSDRFPSPNPGEKELQFILVDVACLFYKFVL
jgi:hypothetical protein